VGLPERTCRNSAVLFQVLLDWQKAHPDEDPENPQIRPSVEKATVLHLMKPDEAPDPGRRCGMKPSSEPKVYIVVDEVPRLLSSIHWAQEEIIDILEFHIREDKLSQLPEQGCGLAQALKVLNGTMEKVINGMIAGEPSLEPLQDDPKFEAAIEQLRKEVAPRVEKILAGELENQGGAA